MTLSETLTFSKATLPKLAIKIHEAAPRVTLSIDAELTAATARVVGCHDSAFDSHDNPRGGFDKMDLPYDIDACRIKLHSLRENGLSLLFTPQKVDKFQVFRLGDAELGLSFSAVTDRARDAIDFMLETAGTQFEVMVEPGQAELDFSGDNSQAGKPIASDEDFMKGLGIGEPDASPNE